MTSWMNLCRRPVKATKTSITTPTPETQTIVPHGQRFFSYLRRGYGALRELSTCQASKDGRWNCPMSSLSIIASRVILAAGTGEFWEILSDPGFEARLIHNNIPINDSMADSLNAQQVLRLLMRRSYPLDSPDMGCLSGNFLMTDYILASPTDDHLLSPQQ
ncbi:hypothetical protein RJZ90_004097 [Blastomyces dermatitidis]